MKKIILLFVALFITVSAANAATDPAAALASGVTESQLLDTLMDEGMKLEEAVSIILGAGGDQTSTLAAAKIINPEFTLASSDPVGDLPDPGAGPGDTPADSTAGDPIVIVVSGGGGGERLGVSP